MPSRPTDPGIPTLTQRAELAPGGLAQPDPPHIPVLDQQVVPEQDPPVLTAIAHTYTPPWEDEIPTLEAVAPPPAPTPREPVVTGATPPITAPDTDWHLARATESSDAQAAVLRAALQAELEQVMQIALEEAIQGIRTRMDTELPGIVARVLERVRPG